MLIAEVQAWMDAQGMLAHHAKVLVAVSGGPDSMALLSILCHLRPVYDLTVAVAHVNHQLRGEEATRDARFVQEQAADLGLSFYQTCVDVKALQRSAGLSPQQAARKLRYDFLAALHRRLGTTHVALGHTADDQAETLLIRLLRGSSPAGLAGIPPVRGPFIRPLLTTRRHAIISYLQAQDIPWVEDSSNTHDVYLRNRVRRDLLPILRQYNPRIIERLNELAHMLGADHSVLERQTAALACQAIRWQPGKRAVIRCASYSTAPVAIQRRVLRRALEALLSPADTVGFRHTERLRRLMLNGVFGQRLTIPGGLLAERHADTVWLWNPDRLPPTTLTLALPVPGSIDILGLDMRLEAHPADRPHDFRSIPSWQAYVDGDRIRAPLVVRFPQPGDRFYPLGSGGGKKLKDFFIDVKVSRAERPYIPVVVSAGEIVWVVGCRLADPFKVRPETRRVLRLQCVTITSPVP